MAYASSQMELQLALDARAPLVEITSGFKLESRIDIEYRVTIRSAPGACEYRLERGTSDAMFYVYPRGALTLERVILNGNGIVADESAVVLDGRAALTNATVRDAVSKGDGGGIYLKPGASLVCSGGLLYGNRSLGRGGAVFIENGATAQVTGRFKAMSNSAHGGNGIYNEGFFGVSCNVEIHDGVCIPDPSNAIFIEGPVLSALIQLEESEYMCPSSPGPFTVARGTHLHPVPTRQDMCAFRPPCDFGGWYFKKSADGSSVYLDSYPEYSITYINLLGADNPNPSKYNESVLHYFLLPPGGIDEHVFTGWYNQSLGGEPVIIIPRGTTGDLTLYARWVRRPPPPCRPRRASTGRAFDYGCGCENKNES